MDKSNRQNTSDHAREISFAIFRVAALIEQVVLRAALESAAVNLTVKSVSVSDNKAVIDSINELDQLVRLAEVIGEIKPLNSKVLLRELLKLKTASLENIPNNEEINLEAMFFTENNKETESNVDIGVGKTKELQVVPDIKIKPSEAPKFNKPIALEANQAVNRQSAILQFIKGLPTGCRMKDLIEKFPNVSERTLRNDLQVLISNSSIERFGAVQGPFSYYRAKTTTSEVSGTGLGSINSSSSSFFLE